MIKSCSTPLARKLIAALGLSVLFSVSALADTAYVTTFVGSTLTVCPPYCVNPLGLTGVSFSSAGSTAIANPPGVPSRTKAAYGFAGAVNWSIRPTLAQPGGVYTIEEAHQAAISSDSANIVMNAFSADGKVSAGCTNTTVFQQANGGDVWKLIGYITNNPGVTQPTIIFHYVSGTVNNTGTGRVYVDAFRFVLADPCFGVAGDVTVVGPISAGDTTVNVSGVVAGATNVTVFANASPIGSAVNLSGFSAGTVGVPTSALNDHDQVTAQQTKNGCVGNLSSAAATGGGANPTLQVALEVGRNSLLAGPIGAGAGGSGTNVYWIHANQRRSFAFAVAPTGGYTITPSTNWVTLTFNSDSDAVYDWSHNTFPYVNPDPYAVLEGLALAIDDTTPDIGPYKIYIDSIYNGTNLIQGFENNGAASYANGTYGVMFLRPGASTTPSGMIYSSPDTNFVNNAGGTNSDTGTNSLEVQWQFLNESINNWVRLYTGGTGTQYPQIDLHQPVTIRMLVLPVGQTIGRRFDGNVSFLTNSSPGFYTTGSNTLGVVITGSGTYTYQWSFNGNDIGGATDASYTIEPFSGITSADQGLYSLTITDEGNGQIVRSVNALITDPLPAISVQPAAITIAHVGDNVTWNVTASAPAQGGLPLNYQWKFNGADIADATDSSFTTNTVAVANAGTYTVAVSNTYGGLLSSAAVLDVVQPGVIVGTGTGLRGEYRSHTYTNNAFGGVPTLVRTDATVNFDWGSGSPDPSIPVDLFTVRWSGQVRALDTDTYTFYAKSDDGQRLWVNGQQLVNDWILHGATEHGGTIALTANSMNTIMMEYFENGVSASSQLSWSAAGGGVVKGIIPQSQLYPASVPIKPGISTSVNQGTNLVISWGAGTYDLTSTTDLQNGPWTTVTNGIISPFTNAIDPNAPKKFYRLQVQ